MADIRHKAVATAGEYNEGNIASLDDAMTRRLIASTVATLSRGGDHDIMNRLGYVGRYRAGAEFLAEAGYIDPDRLQQAMAGHRNEWAWARSGGMAAFLQDPANWKDGLDLATYLRTPQLQDRAFRINAENDFARARAEGFLGDDDKPARIAGFLKAAQVVGFSSAREAMTGGRVFRDANGVSNYDLVHDITRNRDGLDKLMAVSDPQRGVSADAAQSGPAAAPLAASVAEPAHPLHARYQHAWTLLGGVPGLDDDARGRAAASLLVATTGAGFRSFDHLVPGAPGTVFAVEGPMQEPTHRLPLNLAQLSAQPVETSTAQLAVLAASSSLVAQAPEQGIPDQATPEHRPRTL
jgi:hypothetical protein